MNIDTMQSAINGRSKEIMDESIRNIERAYLSVGQEWLPLTDRERSLIQLSSIAGSSATLQIINQEGL